MIKLMGREFGFSNRMPAVVICLLAVTVFTVVVVLGNLEDEVK